MLVIDGDGTLFELINLPSFFLLDTGSFRDFSRFSKSEGLLMAQLPRRIAPRLSGRDVDACLLYTSPSPRDKRQSRMPSSA